MQTSFYNTLFAALPQERRLNNIANNLANLNTAGYKREKHGFVDIYRGMSTGLMDPRPSLRTEMPWPRPNLISQVMLGSTGVDFGTGPLQRTDNPLDLAIQGEGFFKVQTEGGVRYTRNGHFRLTEAGGLVTENGDALLGGGGPLAVPEGTVRLVVSESGAVLADGQEIGSIDLVALADPGILEKEGRNLFRIRRGEDAEELPFAGSVLQGSLEGANVEVVEEMIAMIETLRTFESFQKVMSSTQEMDQKLIQEVGTVR
jgi:flagellar basal-body rod protein FlgF